MSGLETFTHLLRPRRPGAADPEGALVLFHGRGADEHDLYGLLDELDPGGKLLGVTVRAPLSLPPGGAHWYVLGPVGFPAATSFHRTTDALGQWLGALERETGIPPARTILGGFSQGAVMTYAMGLGAGRPRPAGLLALSGFIPTVDGFFVDLEAPLPKIAIGHGSYDPIIPVTFGRSARERLLAAGADVVYRESPMPHAIDPGFLYELADWVSGVMAGASVKNPAQDSTPAT